MDKASSDSWETVVLELVFEPELQNASDKKESSPSIAKSRQCRAKCPAHNSQIQL